jgi:predicted dehydrogenase
VRLAVNQTRRLIPACVRIHELLREGAVGRLQRIEYSEGDRFDWPSATGSLFGRNAAGKGVLLDLGAHALDLICWWLGTKATLVHYSDDSFGGSEAMAHAMLLADGCSVELRLSWLSKLPNLCRFIGDEATIEWGVYDWGALRLISRSGRTRRLGIRTPVRAYADLGPVLIDGFLNTVVHDAAPQTEGHDVLPSLELIDECYARRTRFAMPWCEPLAGSAA